MSKTSFSKLAAGAVLSETQFYKIHSVDRDRVVVVSDSNEKEGIEMSKAYVEEFLISADQFSETKKLTRTELAELFITCAGVALTVNFNTQVKPEDVVQEILKAYENATPKQLEGEVKKAVKRGLEGEERTMIGRHWSSVDDFGRIRFIDMTVAKDNSKNYDSRQRLVDPRTLNWLIVRGVKYVVK